MGPKHLIIHEYVSPNKSNEISRILLYPDIVCQRNVLQELPLGRIDSGYWPYTKPQKLLQQQVRDRCIPKLRYGNTSWLLLTTVNY